jgi:hypothetical protein
MESYSRVGQATGDCIIRRIRVAFWIDTQNKARCFTAATMVTQKRVNVTLYVQHQPCRILSGLMNH